MPFGIQTQGFIISGPGCPPFSPPPPPGPMLGPLLYPPYFNPQFGYCPSLHPGGPMNFNFSPPTMPPLVPYNAANWLDHSNSNPPPQLPIQTVTQIHTMYIHGHLCSRFFHFMHSHMYSSTSPLNLWTSLCFMWCRPSTACFKTCKPPTKALAAYLCIQDCIFRGRHSYQGQTKMYILFFSYLCSLC